MDRTVDDAMISNSSSFVHVAPDAITDARPTPATEDAKEERRLKDAVHRYYALAELIDTERGYVDDLRILVEVYLASLGAVAVPAPRPRAESQPVIATVATEGARFGQSRLSSQRFSSDPSSSRSSFLSYQYPPSSFQSPSVALKDHTRTKPKGRARPASMLFTLQPQTIRLRKDSGPEPYSVRSIGKNGNRAVVDLTSPVESGRTARTRSMGFGLGKSSTNVRTEVRRASVDVVQSRPKPAYGHTFTSSPESSPTISPSTPLSSQPASPLSSGSHVSQRHQRLRASLSDAEKQMLARDVQEILELHERIVKRLEHALEIAQSGVVERRRRVPKGKGKAEKGRSEVECEVEAAVRAVCGVFISEAHNFTPYEVFCADHTEALETVRRIMRGHHSDWMEWEKHCNEVAAQRDAGGTSSIARGTAGSESPLPSPVTVKAIKPSASRNSLLSSLVLDVEDANSSTSTLRRRHSACASTSSLRASASASGSLKHTKSDPTPTAGHTYGIANGLNLGNTYTSLSSLSRRLDTADSMRSPDGIAQDERQGGARNGRTKLSFADYLIKPVQRLCKYPLLFEQLRNPKRREEGDSGRYPSGASGSSRTPDPNETPRKRRGHTTFRLGGDSDDDDYDPDCLDGDATDSAVERVLRKMREVAHAVDEAQRRRDIEKKSALIVERLVAGAPNASHEPHRLSIGLDDEKGPSENGGGLESRSELGHGIGTVSPSASAAWSSKPPTRSLSFSSAFSRSRSRNNLGRMSSMFLHQAGEFSEMNGQSQIPGPPTRVFLTSLGACLLAGSLDVIVTSIDNSPRGSSQKESTKRDSSLSLAGMSALRSNNGIATASIYVSQQTSREPVKVKYLAAFLYVGGYIVLAKTPKAGVYEPRHWFALTDETIEVVDVREDKALLPCSFHLIFHATGHRLELAAACQREKEIWLNAMLHARSLPPMWEYEPVPTLNVSANLVNASARNNLEVPPVPSMPILNNDVLASSRSNLTLRTDLTIKANRRQSINGSVRRSFFMSNSDHGLSVPPTVLIRRVSATRRAQTDRHLADVLSQPLLSARLQAKARDEVLFRDPDPPQQGSGIGVGAMAKNKLMGRESVLISKQCAPSICSSLASSTEQSSTVSESASNVTIQQHSQDSRKGKLIKKNRRGSLSMLLTLPGAISDASLRDGRMMTPTSQGTFSPNSSLPSTSTANSIDAFSRSQCSSASTGAPTPSPVNELFPPEVRVVGVDTLEQTGAEELPDVLDHMERPKRSRSLVDNFRGLFGTPRSLSSSPAPSVSSSRQASEVDESIELPDTETAPRRSMFSKLLRRASFRSRGRSSSNVSDSGQPSSSSSSSAAAVQLASQKPNLMTRSASVLATPKHEVEITIKTRTATMPVQTPTPSRRLNSRPSRSSLMPEAQNQTSLGRSIKYRLFPGNLVPLTPIDRHRDRSRV